MSTETTPQPTEADGASGQGIRQRLNWLRAGVLGANDGIVSVAGIVVGVAGATNATAPIFTAGLAGLVAGAVSMALGEYVSVSSQRDAEHAQVRHEERELQTNPKSELRELTAMYRAKGLSEATASAVATELSGHDALGAHLEVELGIDRDDTPQPVLAAAASASSFVVGASLPMLAVLLPPRPERVAVTFVAVLIALALAGVVSARLGSAPALRAVVRVVVGGALGLAITYGIGRAFGTALG